MGRRPQDTLPEVTAYADTGCEHAPSCLACPFEVCRLERRAAGGPGDRRRRILAAYGRLQSVDSTAAACGVSRRTVFRVLAATRGP